jgi:hypothetical protein
MHLAPFGMTAAFDFYFLRQLGDRPFATPDVIAGVAVSALSENSWFVVQVERRH